MNRTTTIIIIGAIALLIASSGAILELNGACYGVGIAVIGACVSLLCPALIYLDNLTGIAE